MAITVTAGHNHIWNHLERNPDEDDSIESEFIVTSVTPTDGGLELVFPYAGIDFRIIFKSPSIPSDYASWVGQSVAELSSTFDELYFTEQSVYIAGSLSNTIASDTPILGRDFDPKGTDFEGRTAFYSGDDTFYGAATEIPNPWEVDENNIIDDINGFAGNDHFWGRLGDDLFVGGTGIDTAHYEGNLSQFTITQVEGVWNNSVGEGFPGWQISDGSGTEGSDRMTGVERAVFADATVALDLDGSTSAGGIYRLYKAAFNREPDAGGLGYWIAQADAGNKDAVRMAEDFVWSQEFQDLYDITTTDNYGTGTDVSELVTGFYENVLGRTPDQGGLDFYTGVIESKERTVGRVLAEISDSQENYDGTIELIANGIVFDPWVG
jgi:hypothetical protein